MNSSDKYILLSALSFFFVCMALALVWLKGQASVSESYMPHIDTKESRPLQSAESRTAAFPESVLHYSSGETDRIGTVECMLEPEYKNMVNARVIEDGYKLSVTAQIGEDEIEIYRNEDDAFFVIAKGADAIGNTEACIVAKGQGWTFVE